MIPDPVTFTQTSFALFDEEKKGVCMTAYGNLAIFTTRGIAEVVQRQSKRKIKIVEVHIIPVTKANS